MAGTEKYNIHIIANNIGPHEQLNHTCDAGENGPIRIGVFASNGGGKSSLSRQFRLLSLNQEALPLSNKFLTLGKEQGKFKFKFFRQDDPAEKHEFEITHESDKSPKIANSSQLLFHVFNSDYVRESIEPNNYGQDKEIDGYIIGKDVVDLTKENAELESLRKKYGELKEKIDTKIKAGKNELQRAGIRANTTEFTSITFDNIVGNSYMPTEEESLKSIKATLKKLEGIPDDLSDVSFHSTSFGSDLAFLDNLIRYLNKDIQVSKLSEEFKTRISSKEDFIRKGVELLGSSNGECPFCEQNLGAPQRSLIDDFVAYLKDAETVYKNSLMDQIRQEITHLSERSDYLRNVVDEWLASRDGTLTMEQLSELLTKDTVWIATEREALNRLHQQRTTAKATLSERNRALEDLHDLDNKPTNEENKETLQTTFTAKNIDIQQKAARTAEIKVLFDNHKKGKERIALFEKELSEKTVLSENWKKLNDLLGSADGAKFKILAQGYTLDALLSYANKHLQELSKRYEIERIPDTLALQVIDLDMLGEIRTVHSLSGGESFLVSLALALGLSSLSSNRMKVESLFIDEGFGSLDIDTLRIAMDALERLQTQGRKIGIISHVAEMTERVNVQIQVIKTVSGKSNIKIRG